VRGITADLSFLF